MGTILKALGVVFLVLIVIGMVYALVRSLFVYALFAGLIIAGLVWAWRALTAPVTEKAAQATATRDTRKQERAAEKELKKLEAQVTPTPEKAPNVLRIGREK